MSYRIPAINFEQLQRHLELTNKRRTRSGLTPISVRITSTTTETVKNEALGFSYEADVLICEIEGESAPSHSGWTLVAIVEPVSDNECLIREVPGQVCPPKYRVTDLHCDHCLQPRRRKEVYVLKHTDGDTIQVGCNCLADFFGTRKITAFIKEIEALRKIDELYRSAEAPTFFQVREQVVPTIEFVCIASVLSRKYGWVSRAEAKEENVSSKATADKAWMICRDASADWVKQFVQSEGLQADSQDLASAQAAIKWAASIDPSKAKTTYLHDLAVSCRQPVVNFKRAGYVASVLVAYQHYQDQQAANAASKHIGAKGERRVFTNLKILVTTPYLTEFGSKLIVKFIDDSGNVLIWKTTKWPDWVRADTIVSVKATVKDHVEYKGRKETQLVRVTPA